LCCVCCTVTDKRQSQDNQNKEVHIKYTASKKKIPPGQGYVCVLSRDKKSKYWTMKTKKQVKIKYKRIQKKNKSRWGRGISHSPRPVLGPTQSAFLHN
jgi:hypothetical protein